jgi:hypothetical protein
LGSFKGRKFHDCKLLNKDCSMQLLAATVSFPGQLLGAFSSLSDPMGFNCIHCSRAYSHLFAAGTSAWHVWIRLCMDPAGWTQWHLVGECNRMSPAPFGSSCWRLAPCLQSQQHCGSWAFLFWSG